MLTIRRHPSVHGFAFRGAVAAFAVLGAVSTAPARGDAHPCKANYHLFESPVDTIAITEPPEITGDLDADQHLRRLAEKRNYRLQSLPSSRSDIARYHRIQEKAVDDWLQLLSAAAISGIELRIVSGYRSIGHQRRIFLSRLDEAGVTIEDIVNGQADDTIHALLGRHALPGYSRHHTGYAIDLEDRHSGLKGFRNTPGFDWLSKDNYANARRFGFLPSYPDSMPGQGPSPEPWEFVWVGRQNVASFEGVHCLTRRDGIEGNEENAATGG